jgi:hypothetical protein
MNSFLNSRKFHGLFLFSH